MKPEFISIVFVHAPNIINKYRSTCHCTGQRHLDRQPTLFVISESFYSQ